MFESENFHKTKIILKIICSSNIRLDEETLIFLSVSKDNQNLNYSSNKCRCNNFTPEKFIAIINERTFGVKTENMGRFFQIWQAAHKKQADNRARYREVTKH